MKSCLFIFLAMISSSKKTTTRKRFHHDSDLTIRNMDDKRGRINESVSDDQLPKNQPSKNYHCLEMTVNPSYFSNKINMQSERNSSFCYFNDPVLSENVLQVAMNDLKLPDITNSSFQYWLKNSGKIILLNEYRHYLAFCRVNSVLFRQVLNLNHANLLKAYKFFLDTNRQKYISLPGNDDLRKRILISHYDRYLKYYFAKRNYLENPFLNGDETNLLESYREYLDDCLNFIDVIEETDGLNESGSILKGDNTLRLETRDPVYDLIDLNIDYSFNVLQNFGLNEIVSNFYTEITAYRNSQKYVSSPYETIKTIIIKKLTEKKPSYDHGNNFFVNSFFEKCGFDTYFFKITDGFVEEKYDNLIQEKLKKVKKIFENRITDDLHKIELLFVIIRKFLDEEFIDGRKISTKSEIFDIFYNIYNIARNFKKIEKINCLKYNDQIKIILQHKFRKISLKNYNLDDNFEKNKLRFHNSPYGYILRYILVLILERLEKKLEYRFEDRNNDFDVPIDDISKLIMFAFINTCQKPYIDLRYFNNMVRSQEEYKREPWCYHYENLIFEIFDIPEEIRPSYFKKYE